MSRSPFTWRRVSRLRQWRLRLSRPQGEAGNKQGRQFLLIGRAGSVGGCNRKPGTRYHPHACTTWRSGLGSSPHDDRPLIDARQAFWRRRRKTRRGHGAALASSAREEDAICSPPNRAAGWRDSADRSSPCCNLESHQAGVARRPGGPLIGWHHHIFSPFTTIRS